MASAKRGTQREPKQRTSTRDRLLDAAIATLRESGLQRLTQPQVAERAGVRQSHLTYYFPTRDDLLEAVTARAVEGIAHHAVPAGGTDHESAADPASLLRRLAAAEVERGHMRMFLGLVVEADGDPTVRDMLVRGTQHIEGALAEQLGGETARARARLVITALWGLGLYQFLVRPTPRSDPTREYLSFVVKLAESSSGRRKSHRRR